MEKMDDIDNNAGHRSFGTIDDSANTLPSRTIVSDKINNTIESIRNDIMGVYDSFGGPFGDKPIVYADWTASGRSVHKIEKYLLEEVMPLYGNTHTTTSNTGHQTTCYRHEARQIIAESVNAKVTGKAAEDVVIFTGNGTTAAVKKLVQSLGLHLPFPVDAHESERPVVFTSSYEHHSNMLPWRESVADVVTINYSPLTGVCLLDLERQLNLHKDRKVKIGTFSAASNVTGILTAVDAVSILLHLHGALAIFDYATAAPYVHIDMNPVQLEHSSSGNTHSNLAYKDAIFFSGHKFLGGPGCPGVLVAKRRLMPQAGETPTTAGGGTVFYVTDEHHRYLSNREEREEGGTPHVLGDVKLGLAMHLKQSVGGQWIQSEELRLSEYVQRRLQSESSDVILVGRDRDLVQAANTLPVFSFLIRCADRFLHFHFVSVLLNDLFGVQARGGCMCAGPFSQLLLGIDRKHNEAFETALLEKHEVLRPGYTRLSLPYWTAQEEVDYVVDAILFIAQHGWKFLPMYRYNYKTGEWAHTTRLTRFPERKWLSNFSINAENNSNTASTTTSIATNNDASQSPLARALAVWKVGSVSELFSRVKTSVAAELDRLDKAILKMNSKKTNINYSASTTTPLSDDLASFEHLRWFVLSEETSRPHFSPSTAVPLKGPINPPLTVPTNSNTESSDDTNSSGGAQHTAYVAMRNEKLKAHTGNDVKLPRYLQLLSKAESLSSSTDNLNIVDLLHRNAIHPATGGAAAATPPVAASTITPKMSKPAAKSEPSPQVILENATVTVTAVTSADVSETADLSPLSLDTCSTGECVQRSNNIVPTTTITAINSASGKILSGPGTTYAVTPSTVIAGSDGVASGAGSDGSRPKPKVIVPPKKIMKAVGNAVKDWNMIEEGDRILLGLSGGKDSLAMLHVLLALQKRAPVKFSIACATVDPQTSSFDPSPLIPYVQSLGITYHYLSEPIVELAKSKMQGDSLCAFCSRFKRGLLYSCCRNNGYNKLVLAQHLDDLVESFLMSALHNGQIRTMKANYKIEAGDVNVIRPFVYVRETATRDFSQSVHLPIINENCPACFEQPKERARVKKLLLQEEAMIPALFFNFKRALLPLMHDETYDAMARVCATVEQNSYQSSNRDRNVVSSKARDSNKVPAVSANEEDDEVVFVGEGETKTLGEGSASSSAAAPAATVATTATTISAAGRVEHSDAIVAEIINNVPTCEPGSKFCAPCFELA